MTSTDRNTTLKRLVDVASAIFLITPFICGAWLFILFHSSKNGLLSIASTPTIFGWLPAPMEIIIVDFIPFMVGLMWLLYRRGPALLARYPVIPTWKFMVPAAVVPASLIILARILYNTRILHHIFGGGTMNTTADLIGGVDTAANTSRDEIELKNTAAQLLAAKNWGQSGILRGWNSAAQRICWRGEARGGAPWLGSAGISCPTSPCT